MTAKEMIVEQKAKAQSVVDGFDALEAQLDLDLKGEFDRGFAEGKLSMGNPGDKIYDQAEVDAMLKPIQESLVAKEAQIAQLQLDIDGIKASIDEQVKVKLESELTGILSEFDAQQSDESAKEGAFRKFVSDKIAPPAGN